MFDVRTDQNIFNGFSGRNRKRVGGESRLAEIDRATYRSIAQRNGTRLPHSKTVYMPGEMTNRSELTIPETHQVAAPALRVGGYHDGGAFCGPLSLLPRLVHHLHLDRCDENAHSAFAYDRQQIPRMRAARRHSDRVHRSSVVVRVDRHGGGRPHHLRPARVCIRAMYPTIAELTGSILTFDPPCVICAARLRSHAYDTTTHHWTIYCMPIHE
jgi:hypothetical protein